MMRFSGVSGRDEQQAAQRGDADEVPARIDDVEIEHHLDVARAFGAP